MVYVCSCTDLKTNHRSRSYHTRQSISILYCSSCSQRRRGFSSKCDTDKQARAVTYWRHNHSLRGGSSKCLASFVENRFGARQCEYCHGVYSIHQPLVADWDTKTATVPTGCSICSSADCGVSTLYSWSTFFTLNVVSIVALWSRNMALVCVVCELSFMLLPLATSHNAFWLFTVSYNADSEMKITSSLVIIVRHMFYLLAWFGGN